MENAIETLSGVLALVALVGAVGIVIVRLIAPRSAVAGAAARLIRWRVPVSALIGATATFGSLYFSEVLHFEPCRLCWFQRTMMYPIGVIGVVAWIRRDALGRWYFIALSGIGLAISAWHNLVELFPNLESNSCALLAPCAVPYFRSLHFFSLATMALSGFLAVLVLNTIRFPSTVPPGSHDADR